MAVKVYWENDEKTIIRYDFEGHWTWDDLYPEYDRAIKMEKSVDHCVDVILDMRESQSIPLSAITHVRSIAGKQPDNVGLSVLVTTNRAILTLYNVGMKIDKNIAKYFAAASTIEEAYALIAEAVKS